MFVSAQVGCFLPPDRPQRARRSTRARRRRGRAWARGNERRKLVVEGRVISGRHAQRNCEMQMWSAASLSATLAAAGVAAIAATSSSISPGSTLAPFPECTPDMNNVRQHKQCLQTTHGLAGRGWLWSMLYVHELTSCTCCASDHGSRPNRRHLRSLLRI